MAKITKRSLRKFNLIAAGLHFVQAAAVLVLSKDFYLPVTGSYLRYDEATKQLVPATKTLFQMPYVWLIVGFFLLSAAAHLFIATVYNHSYNRNLNLGINKVRWIEYGLSASTMMVAIAMLVGVYDASSLTMIFGLTAIMNLMGLAMELYNQNREKVSWLSYFIGSFAGLIPWLVIAFYLWLGASQGSSAPTFVYFIFVSIFVFFNCFAINMLLQYKRIGKWADYLYGERAYIWLSLIAKSVLAWQVFAGTLRP
ncbi:heliorhodopsin HeR [Candidatus Saccharibacteria bacterium]|nr:heliorhodopsin HeR [Candidatus Saccharibacteria bacterium]